MPTDSDDVSMSEPEDLANHATAHPESSDHVPHGRVNFAGEAIAISS
jgi:hypothetical protein